MSIHTITKEGDIVVITNKRTVMTLEGQEVEILAGTEEINVQEINDQIKRCDAQITSYQAEKEKYESMLNTLNLEIKDDVVVDKIEEIIK